MNNSKQTEYDELKQMINEHMPLLQYIKTFNGNENTIRQYFINNTSEDYRNKIYNDVRRLENLKKKLDNVNKDDYDDECKQALEQLVEWFNLLHDATKYLV